MPDPEQTEHTPLFHGLYDDGSQDDGLAQARALALPAIATRPEHGFYLATHDNRLTLCRAGTSATRGLYVDFNEPGIRRRIAAGRRGQLGRALGLHKRPGMRVLDLTCGLGRDSAVIAGLGGRLVALERHAALHALVADGLRRASTLPWRADWLELNHADGATWLQAQAAHAPAFEVIYMDPMFDNTRRKARPQRAMQWLGELLGADTDAPELLGLARRHATRRVVVKSHARAAPLAPPDHQFGGKAARFDVYFSASNACR